MRDHLEDILDKAENFVLMEWGWLKWPVALVLGIAGSLIGRALAMALLKR